ncbi:MAG: agmatine deiminase [Rhodospirillales bacterium]|nr:agmatine deiminase [Rhodospirillales bacterium]
MRGTPAAEGFVQPAEWTRHARTWMAWPARAATWVGGGGIEAARTAHADLARLIARYEPVRMVCAPGDVAEASLACGPGIEIVPVPLSDGWMRDIGPIFVRNERSGEVAGVDFHFNGWGGIHEDWQLDADVAEAVLTNAKMRRFEADFTLEGGAICVDGTGTAMVTEECLLDPRRNEMVDKIRIERWLREQLGVEKTVWLGRGYDQDETRGHVDEIACFARPGVVLLHTTTDVGDRNYEIGADNLDRLHAVRDAQGRVFEVIELPQPARLDENGRRLTLSYVNFVFVNGGLLIPAFEDAADKEAFRIFKRVFPDREIVPVPALDLVRGGGGLHCVTLQEPAPRGA